MEWYSIDPFDSKRRRRAPAKKSGMTHRGEDRFSRSVLDVVVCLRMKSCQAVAVAVAIAIASSSGCRGNKKDVPPLLF